MNVAENRLVPLDSLAVSDQVKLLNSGTLLEVNGVDFAVLPEGYDKTKMSRGGIRNALGVKEPNALVGEVITLGNGDIITVDSSTKTSILPTAITKKISKTNQILIISAIAVIVIAFVVKKLLKR